MLRAEDDRSFVLRVRTGASLCMADSTPTAILTLTAQTHDSFGVSELTRVGSVDARVRTGGLGAGTRV